ncbi:MAG: hypothetical protein P8101_15150 [Candidatus Thiodiazotropha sp.]
MDFVVVDDKASVDLGHKGSGAVKGILLASSLMLGFVAQPAQAALTFNFNYLSDGVGFTDPTYGAQRQAALNSAANRLGAYFSNYTAEVTYDVTSYSMDDNTLASAGSGAYLDPGHFQQTFVQSKILTGVDANGSAADGEINWNFFHNWGLGDAVASDQYDFTSTAMHELMHSFGFISYIGEGGVGGGGQNPGNADTWTIYDEWLVDANGDYLISDDGVFYPESVDALTAGTENSAGVYFAGEHAVAANDGQWVPIYSPAPWDDGSSIAHLDDNSDITDYVLMNAVAHGTGLDVRTLSGIELGVLQDIGYTQVSAVPVPAAIWFMASGLLALFGFSRKHKEA